ncbi:hypothetical protein L2E82_48462 [Cichorium intybus]|uniref:Uncharacterized protein n=1 Tax=Cichorium intybus TaxID=13427 RepID=A0ACB8YY50_CICIN|nr:hypothetical protein L2E82_48462 [Cichorium intybus]
MTGMESALNLIPSTSLEFHLVYEVEDESGMVCLETLSWQLGRKDLGTATTPVKTMVPCKTMDLLKENYLSIEHFMEQLVHKLYKKRAKIVDEGAECGEIWDPWRFSGDVFDGSLPGLEIMIDATLVRVSVILD